MLAVNYTNFRDNMKAYMDKVTDAYETMIVTRKNNKNVVILSEEAYNNLMENKANYDWLMESKAQLESGKTCIQNLVEAVKVMNILVIDGQGGQLGGQIIKSLKVNFCDIKIMAVGTNTTATGTMLKAGADQAATGENPVIVACRKADIIIGPIGVIIADALFGEITPQMAVAVGQADAVRILLPVNKCNNLVAGVPALSTAAILEDVISKVRGILG